MSSDRLSQLMELLKSEPDDSFLNYALALECAKAGDTNRAIALIEKLIEKDENYLGAYYQLGKLYEQTNNKEKAILIYNQGLAIAEIQRNRKAAGELNEAIWMLED